MTVDNSGLDSWTIHHFIDSYYHLHIRESILITEISMRDFVHYDDVMWALKCIISPDAWPFVQNVSMLTTKNTKSLHYVLFLLVMWNVWPLHYVIMDIELWQILYHYSPQVHANNWRLNRNACCKWIYTSVGVKGVLSLPADDTSFHEKNGSLNKTQSST